MAIVKIPKSALLQLLDDEAVLLDLNTEKFYALNSTACFLLKRSLEFDSIEQVVTATVAHFSIPRCQAESDLDQLLRELLDKSLIER